MQKIRGESYGTLRSAGRSGAGNTGAVLFIQKGAADLPATPSVTGQQSFAHFYTARQGLCDKKGAADKMVTTQATYTF